MSSVVVGNRGGEESLNLKTHLGKRSSTSCHPGELGRKEKATRTDRSSEEGRSNFNRVRDEG